MSERIEGGARGRVEKSLRDTVVEMEVGVPNVEGAKSCERKTSLMRRITHKVERVMKLTRRLEQCERLSVSDSTDEELFKICEISQQVDQVVMVTLFVLTQ